ncbi:MAG: histidine kinase [Cytophagales bacterium]|nr:histidine kinase [Cytophagales bacterium]
MTLTGQTESYPLYGHVSYLIDEGRTLTLADVQKPAQSAAFQSFGNRQMNLGSVAGVVWLRFTVMNRTEKDWLLELSNALLEDVTFYKTAGGTLLATRQAGFYHPKAPRDIESNFYIFSLYAPGVPTPDTLVCYLRVVNSMPMQFPMQVATARQLYRENHVIDVANGVYIGIVLVMIFYNLFVYASVRDKTYLFYVGYVFFAGMVISDFQGYVFDLFWRHTLAWVPFIDFVPAMLGNIFALLFAWHFLDTPTHTPRMHKGIKLLLALAATILVAGFVTTLPGMQPYKVWLELSIQGVVFCSSVYMLGVGALLLYRQKRPALFYVLAWTVFLIGTVLFILQIDGLVPNNFLTENAIQIGSGIEAVLLSLALADRINIYKMEREKAQNRYIQQLQETEQVRSRIARDLHDDIGSTLSSIAILSQVAQQQAQDSAAGQILHKISNSAQKMMDAMQDIVWTAQPTSDSLNSVSVRMREFAAEALEARNIQYDIRVDDRLMALKLATKQNYDLYMVFKEAVNNAAKYSEATHVQVSFEQLGHHLRLRIQDNGKGFDPDRMRANGNGLGNMRKRAAQLNGHLLIDTQNGHGTTVELKFPLGDNV